MELLSKRRKDAWIVSEGSYHNIKSVHYVILGKQFPLCCHP